MADETELWVYLGLGDTAVFNTAHSCAACNLPLYVGDCDGAFYPEQGEGPAGGLCDECFHARYEIIRNIPHSARSVVRRRAAATAEDKE
jgi:hypothetical protein